MELDDSIVVVIVADDDNDEGLLTLEGETAKWELSIRDDNLLNIVNDEWGERDCEIKMKVEVDTDEVEECKREPCLTWSLREGEEDYLEGYEDECEGDEDETRSRNRRRLRGEREAISHVEEMRRLTPRLRKDEGALVKALAVKMRSFKRPAITGDIHTLTKNGHYLCCWCPKETMTLAACQRHYREKHGPFDLVCYACGVDFRSTTNLYKHEKRCIATDAPIVLRARALVLGNKGRSRPYMPPKTFNTVQRFNCDMCPAVFMNKYGLDSHVNAHKGTRPYQCESCTRAYTSQAALTSHLAVHGPPRYICDYCGRRFKRKTSFVVHIHKHSVGKRYSCGDCGRRFAQKCGMELHARRVHLGLPPPHPCKICTRRFNRLPLLNAHMRREHGVQLITRQMFFKRLPQMTEVEMPEACLVFNSKKPPTIKLS